MWESITPAEYETWLPPPIAIAKMKPFAHENFVRDELWRQVCSGQLRSVAKVARWQITYTTGYDEREYEILAGLLWKTNPQPEHYDIMWLFGSRIFKARDNQLLPLVDTECFGIRFDPAGVDRILTDAGHVGVTASEQANERSRRQDLPTLPQPIAEAWIAWFKAQPNATKQRAEQSALHMFPNHNLSRDRIRDLFGDSREGRPKKRTT